MILDERNEFADATALGTGGTGRANVGDVIPLTNLRNISSPTKPLYLVIGTVAAVTSGGAATLSFELVTDISNPPLTNATATIHYKSKDFALAELGANTVLCVIPLPGEPPVYEGPAGVLGIQQNVGVAALTGGSINAFLTHDPKQWKAYADAI